ncbi:MAG: Uncharacterised protein [Flavobacteriales bacterium]|nr:MAG: Uncharacterised protein [Flavobacteriales bacterium]
MFSINGRRVGKYMTFAPKKESSIASLYERNSIGEAFFTILGFALKTPLTSVQISKDLALRYLAYIAAL